MCQFFSAIIVDKNRKALWDFEIDSHTELLEKFKLRDDNISPNFVRVEFTPLDNDVFNHDFSKWRFKTDQDYRPDWYDEGEAKKTTELALKEPIGERFIIGRTVDEIKSGRWWAKDAVIKDFSGGTLSNFWGGTLSNFSGGTLQDFWGGTLQDFRGGTLQDFKKDGTGVMYNLSENKIIVANPKIKIVRFKPKKVNK